MKTFAATIMTLASAGMVSAHGYVTNATIGGQSYEFYQPYSDAYTSPTPDRVSRPIQGNGPVEDVTISDIQCGGYTAGGINGSSPAALHAAATAGSDVTLYWTLWPDSHYGAMITYMARCPDTGCNDYMPESDAVWFKVKEGGLLDKATATWADSSLMVSGNSGYTYTIPECLADGYYLVRHEIIAVFVASSYPGAQFYPGCHQLQVTGGGSTTVTDNLVGFPGAYAGSDPGITYDSNSDTYTIPGPALFTCDGSSSSSSGSTDASSSVVSSAVAATSTVAAAASSTSKAAAATSVVATAAAAAATKASSVSAVASASGTEASVSCSEKRNLRRNKRSRAL